ncbi:MAG: helix-turn-helix domain-containing protein [Ignavibacteria bacterium]|nr:MAG: helix-turn-helix domain-containing protein [Ignavibacteria bacterium]
MKHAPHFYDETFKRRALEMVAAGRTLASVARELGIDVKRLSYWKRTLGAAAAAGQKTPDELAAEVRALRRRAERAEMELAILKSDVDLCRFAGKGLKYMFIKTISTVGRCACGVMCCR